MDDTTAAGVDRYVREHGLLVLFAYLRTRYPDERRRRAGRSKIDDTERLARFTHHLTADRDLVALADRAGRAGRTPNQRRTDARRAAREAARRANRDCPQLKGDIRDDGSVRPAAINRLLNKVEFGVDTPWGFGLGKWRLAGFRTAPVSSPCDEPLLEHDREQVRQILEHHAPAPSLSDEALRARDQAQVNQILERYAVLAKTGD